MKILEIGCGNSKSYRNKDKVIGLDMAKLPGVDVVHDLEKTPLPFRENEFDKIFAFHVLEHVQNFIPLMEDLWRISKNNSQIHIKTPFYSSWGQFNDPTHVRFFSPFTFDYFIGKNNYSHQVKEKKKMDFEIKEVRIHFGIGKSKILNKFIDPLLNFNHKFYCRFFAWTIPAAEIEFKLKVIK